jgi:hypothetical protein
MRPCRLVRPLLFSSRQMLTNIYVDGFNLYSGALKGTPFRWLDLNKLCSLLLPRFTINRIKYFTARIRARHDDPGCW